MAVSEWNYCPICGHRLYQHNGEGCTHVDMEESYERVRHDLNQRVTKDIPCDCTHPHPLMAKVGS